MKNSPVRTLIRYTVLGRLFMIPVRFLLFGAPQVWQRFWAIARWTFTSREYYNWTYHLSELNRDYLASYISVVSGHDTATIEKYIRELEADEQLRSILTERTLTSPDRHSCDAEPRYGKRLGWYALIRATKPRVIVETGVDRGLGTAVMAAALLRNDQEGYPGVVYATDIAPDCGHLVTEPYRKYCRLLIGDSVESLKKIDQTTDIFLHDSLHTPEYEWAEFLAIEPRLHPGSLVMSDNSIMTDKLLEFAKRRNLSFLFFQDQPANHWCSGDGIGLAFVPGKKYFFPKES